jgi:hypothetical protein
MIRDESLALFLLLGQTAEKSLADTPSVAPAISIPVSDTIDLALLLPEESKEGLATAKAYVLFYIFEQYLRSIVQEVLTKAYPADWWDKIPVPVQEDIQKLEATEEIKNWMALGSRDRFALMTFAQLIAVIDHNWKNDFEDLVGDKGLLHEARLIGHLRNRVAHMSPISAEEIDRIKQTIRDWLRRVSP